MTTREWGEENGSTGACACCGRKTWIESGCAALCDGCDSEDPDECSCRERHRPQTLADVGMCEADFR